eukprot:304814_1
MNIMKSAFVLMILINTAFAPCVQNKREGEQCSNAAPCSTPHGNCGDPHYMCRAYKQAGVNHCDACEQTHRGAVNGICFPGELVHGCWGEQGTCARGLECKANTRRYEPCEPTVANTPGCVCRPKPDTAHEEYDDLMDASYGDDDLFYEEAVLNLQIAEEGIEFARAVKAKKRA